MPSAKYTVFVPAGTNAPFAAYQYLTDGPIRTEAVHVSQGFPDDRILVYAEETPEVDGHMKQLGVYLAEAVNASHITVVKEGKNGVATWAMANKHFQPATVHQDLTSPSAFPPNGPENSERGIGAI